MIGTLIIKGAFRPLQDWVVIEPKHASGVVKGGIETIDSEHDYGSAPVVAVGPDCELKPGQVIWIQRFVRDSNGLSFELNGKRVTCIRERHLNVRLEDDGLTSPGKRRKKAA